MLSALDLTESAELAYRRRLDMAGYVLAIESYIQHRFTRQKKPLGVFVSAMSISAYQRYAPRRTSAIYMPGY
jgi:hypothetical protein